MPAGLGRGVHLPLISPARFRQAHLSARWRVRDCAGELREGERVGRREGLGVTGVPCVSISCERRRGLRGNSLLGPVVRGGGGQGSQVAASVGRIGGEVRRPVRFLASRADTREDEMSAKRRPCAECESAALSRPRHPLVPALELTRAE